MNRPTRIRLVVNADDLGLHPDIDEGILRANREGILTSASVLVTAANAEAAVRRAKEQGLALGVHLCLSTRLPPAATNVPTVAPGGRMRQSWADFAKDWALGRVRTEEVVREWIAQVKLARALGFEPDHLDGHQHLQLLPGLSGVIRGVSEATKLPVRWLRERPSRVWLRSPRALAKSAVLGVLSRIPMRAPKQALGAVGAFESGALDEAALSRLIDSLPPGDHEILCHPGGADEVVVPEEPGWRYGWTRELAALCSPRIRERLERRGIALTTYGALFAGA